MKTPQSLRRYLPIGSLGVSLLLHMLIFLGISGVILIQAVVPKVPFVAAEPASPSDSLPLPPEPEDEMTPAPVTDSVDLAREPTALSFSLDTQIASQNAVTPAFTVGPMMALSGLAGGGVPDNSAASTNAKSDAAARAVAKFNPFGNTTAYGDSLQGYIYDLTKSPDGKPYKAKEGGPKVQVSQMIEAISALYKNRGDRAYLDRKFFRGQKPLYAPMIFMQPLRADQATTAFGCAGQVACPGWMAHYEGWMTPPETGEYRFVGMADDVMLVVVDGRPALYAFWPGQGLRAPIQPMPSGWLPRDMWETDGRSAAKGIPEKQQHHTRYYGQWLSLEKGKAYRIAVIISEGWGGVFDATLGIEKRGVEYPKGGGPFNQSLLPIFKLSNTSLPDAATMDKWPSNYTADGPCFGLGENGMKPPQP
ncbi:MAG: hypothetical protein LBK60_05570 [Verrucomicrobiales bacterium]|jgi:hypothetical protein|nr:hypothetical protein [Verrucomicrobiales bacterium]